jgi:glycosyltransferase involved in cell wall biosynthesis
MSVVRGAGPRVSGIVTCYNEQDNIAACLESMSWCDEIVVVDSHSTDGTVEKASAFDNVRLFQRPYYGGASQKNWAVGKTRFDWVFILDADERCPEPLRREILGLLHSASADTAYTIRRKVYCLGRQIRYCGWQNDRVVRLFRSNKGCYENRRVHARMITAGPAPTLRNHIEHYMIDDLPEYARRLEKYAYWGAAQYWVDGRAPRRSWILLRPLWRFVRNYLLRLGFLDGTRGLAFCLLQSYATFLKWSMLWSFHVDARRGIQPLLPEFDHDRSVWQDLDRLAPGHGRGRPSSRAITRLRATPSREPKMAVRRGSEAVLPGEKAEAP